MNEERNKEAVRDFFAAIDGGQNMDPLEQLADTTYVGYFPGTPPMQLEAMMGFGNGFFAACPGLSHSVDELIAEGDAVAARLTIRGTHSQPFITPAGAIPPLGRTFELEAINFYRFHDGKVVEHRSAFDMLNFLQQIGAVPAPEASAA